jgi:hypothetical protein
VPPGSPSLALHDGGQDPSRRAAIFGKGQVANRYSRISG